MNILSLLNRSLKDDEIIEILEWADAQVVYDFDRSHENIPDIYWASCQSKGLCLRFDEEQRLGTIFLYVRGIEEYAPADLAQFDGINFFPDIAQVEEYAKNSGVSYRCGERPHQLPPCGKWIRIEMKDYSLHYEFRDEGLALVTVCRKELGQ